MFRRSYPSFFRFMRNAPTCGQNNDLSKKPNIDIRLKSWSLRLLFRQASYSCCDSLLLELINIDCWCCVIWDKGTDHEKTCSSKSKLCKRFRSIRSSNASFQRRIGFRWRCQHIYSSYGTVGNNARFGKCPVYFASTGYRHLSPNGTCEPWYWWR